MNRIKLWIIPLALLCLGIGGCAQDSIFYNISNEIIPKDPTIPGSPTKILRIGKELYVASGRIFKYANSSGGWRALDTTPSGFVADISFTKDKVDPDKNTLYALTTGSTVWKRRNDEVTWDEVPNGTEYPFIHAIFGTADQMFAAGARYASSSSGRVFDYAILYEDGTGEFQLLTAVITTINNEKRNVEKLSGAGKIGSTYYLGTMGTGILSVTSLDPAAVAQEPLGVEYGGIIAGLIQPTIDPSTGNPFPAGYELIIAASRDGYIFVRSDKSTSFVSKGSFGTFTGALALAEATYLTTSGGAALPPQVMLLIGVRVSTYTYGYREILFDINAGAIDQGWTWVQVPGGAAPSTITNTPKYNSSLGKLPVNAMTAFSETAASGEKTQLLLASTQSSGLYSYRNEEWNGEQ
jgi:hypothetical protein